MSIFNRLAVRAVLCAGLATAGLVAAAAPGPLRAQAEAPASARPVSTWSHDRSGLALPAALAGFERGDSRQFDAEGYNVSVAFHEQASESWATLFIYRAAPASVPLWGDRAAAGMFANPMLGAVDPAMVRIARFTPPAGAGANSGLMITTPASGGEVTASGLALWLHDGWLVKLRMSTRRLDVTAIEARMRDFVAALAFPAALRPAPPFTDIADCAAPLKPGKKAKLAKLDMMGAIMLGGVLGVAHDKQQAEGQDESEAQAWCRDPASQPQYGIYRRAGEEQAYLIGLGDTGTSLSVGSYDLGPLMKPSRGFLVRQSDGVSERVYPPFDRLPTPEQAMGLPGNVAPVFSAGLLTENEGTTIAVPPK